MWNTGDPQEIFFSFHPPPSPCTHLMPCFSPFSFWERQALQSSRQEARGKVCCHLADNYSLRQLIKVFFFFLKASGNIINLFVTDTGFLLSMPSAGFDLLFLPSAVLWKVFICEAAEPEPIAFLVKDKKWKAMPAFLNPLIVESWPTPGEKPTELTRRRG